MDKDVNTLLADARAILENYSSTKPQRLAVIHRINDYLGDRTTTPLESNAPKPVGRSSYAAQYFDTVKDWLENEYPHNAVMVGQITQGPLNIPPGCSSQPQINAVMTILTQLGWKAGKYEIPGEHGLVPGYKRPHVEDDFDEMFDDGD